MSIISHSFNLDIKIDINYEVYIIINSFVQMRKPGSMESEST